MIGLSYLAPNLRDGPPKRLPVGLVSSDGLENRPPPEEGFESPKRLGAGLGSGEELSFFAAKRPPDGLVS